MGRLREGVEEEKQRGRRSGRKRKDGWRENWEMTEGGTKREGRRGKTLKIGGGRERRRRKE